MEPWEKASAIRVLRGGSVLGLARALGLHQSAVAEYLKGHPARLSAERVARVLDALGLDQAPRLMPGIVHRWEIRDGAGLDALRLVLIDEGSGWELLPLDFSGGITLPPVPFYALRRAGGLLVLVKYNPRLLSLSPAFPAPARLAGVEYAPGVSQDRPQQIDAGMGRRWWDGGDVAPGDFDALFGQAAPPPTWDDVRRAAERAGRTPADVLHLLQICSTQDINNH